MTDAEIVEAVAAARAIREARLGIPADYFQWLAVAQVNQEFVNEVDRLLDSR